jgi:hypothetical protein
MKNFVLFQSAQRLPDAALVAGGNPADAHSLAEACDPVELAALAAAVAQLVAMFAAAVAAYADRRATHPHDQPLDAAGVVDLARVACALAGQSLYLDYGDDPDNTPGIAGLFAEGVAYETDHPDERMTHARRRRHSRPRRP